MMQIAYAVAMTNNDNTSFTPTQWAEYRALVIANMLAQKALIAEQCDLRLLAVITEDDADVIGPECDAAGIAYITVADATAFAVPSSADLMPRITEQFPYIRGCMFFASPYLASPGFVQYVVNRFANEEGFGGFVPRQVWMQSWLGFLIDLHPELPDDTGLTHETRYNAPASEGIVYGRCFVLPRSRMDRLSLSMESWTSPPLEVVDLRMIPDSVIATRQDTITVTPEDPPYFDSVLESEATAKIIAERVGLHVTYPPTEFPE
jgi:hypothetical protein